MPPQAYTDLMRDGGQPAVFIDIKSVYRQASNKKDILYWSL
jgi:hypothetical protein